MAEVQSNELALSSGVTVEVLPFPARLFVRLQQEMERKFPDAVPPKKTIEVVDGTEEVDDLENEEYKAEQEAIEEQRKDWLTEKVLDVLLKFCVVLDLDEHEEIIKSLEETLWEFPKDLVSRRAEFVGQYAARTRKDFDDLIFMSLEQVTISDEEVADRIKSFQSNLAGTEDRNTEARSDNTG